MSTETPEQPVPPVGSTTPPAGTSPATPPSSTSFPSGSSSSGSALVPPAPADEADVVEPEADKPDTSELSHDDRVVLATLPTAQTATDAQGTERIVVPDLNASGWRPAPLEPDAEEVARLERRQAAIVAQDAERAKALGL